MGDIRDILVQVCKTIEGMDEFIAKDLKYEQEIYIAPSVTWLDSGSPLEIQVIEDGDQTIDRDGSVRRAQLAITIALLLRRPTQYQSKHASILQSISNDIQTYCRAIRSKLEQNFLSATLIIGDPTENLLVRPLVYIRGFSVQTNPTYPDLLIKPLAFTGGINDALL